MNIRLLHPHQRFKHRLIELFQNKSGKSRGISRQLTRHDPSWVLFKSDFVTSIGKPSSEADNRSVLSELLKAMKWRASRKIDKILQALVGNRLQANRRQKLGGNHGTL